MIKYVSFVAALLITGILFTSCTTIPQSPNLTGAWEYSLTDSATEKVNDGSMTLTQKAFDVTGKANDAFGEFAVSGNVSGPTFVLKFVKNDNSLNYTVNVSMTSEDTFNGTFTTDTGKAGKISGKRNK